MELSRVVRMRRLYTSFWRRLDGSLDVGASYTSASELFKLDLAGTIGVERPGYEVSLDGSSTLTTQPDVDDTRRSLLAVGYERRFPGPLGGAGRGPGWSRTASWASTCAARARRAAGATSCRSQSTGCWPGCGLSVNRERPTDEGETTTNVEATVRCTYDRFSYDFPNVDVAVAVGRVREPDRRRALPRWTGRAAEAGAREGLLRDPPGLRELRQPARDGRGAVHNDYGITFALGWSF